jgi:hypothetical protein
MSAAKKVARRATVKPANDAPIPFVPATAPESPDAVALKKGILAVVDQLEVVRQDLDLAGCAAEGPNECDALAPFIWRVERSLVRMIEQLDRLRGAS